MYIYTKESFILVYKLELFLVKLNKHILSTYYMLASEGNIRTIKR